MLQTYALTFHHLSCESRDDIKSNPHQKINLSLQYHMFKYVVIFYIYFFLSEKKKTYPSRAGNS